MILKLLLFKKNARIQRFIIVFMLLYNSLIMLFFYYIIMWFPIYLFIDFSPPKPPTRKFGGFGPSGSGPAPPPSGGCGCGG